MIGILLIILSVIFLAMPVTGTLYSKFGYFKRFYHDILKWHEPTDECWWDGCTVHSKCKYCGKEIMRDSQGNWF